MLGLFWGTNSSDRAKKNVSTWTKWQQSSNGDYRYCFVSPWHAIPWAEGSVSLTCVWTCSIWWWEYDAMAAWIAGWSLGMGVVFLVVDLARCLIWKACDAFLTFWPFLGGNTPKRRTSEMSTLTRTNYSYATMSSMHVQQNTSGEDHLSSPHRCGEQLCEDTWQWEYTGISHL